MGSADLMTRNLDHRVEVVFPIENAENIRHIRYDMLDTYLMDNTRARLMQAGGTYTRLKPEGEEKAVDVQEYFMNSATANKSKNPRLTPMYAR